jgi:hypothetical protein
MCDIAIKPVITDAVCRKLVKEKPGFDKKLNSIMEALGMM